MTLNSSGGFERLDPPPRPLGVIRHHGLGMSAAANDESRMKGAARRRAGRLIAKVYGPAYLIRVVGRRAVRGVPVHEDDSTLLHRHGARCDVRQKVRSDGRAAF